MLTLTRTYSNKDVTHGELTCDEDKSFKLLTLERARPWKEDQKFRYRCLAPGDYKLEVSVKVLSYQGTTIASPWISLCKVKGYPCASFSTVYDEQPEAGMIVLGTEHQPFSITTDSDHVTRTMARLARLLYDPDTGIERYPLILQIRDSPTLLFENTSQRDLARQHQLEEELRLKREAEQSFFV